MTVVRRWNWKAPESLLTHFLGMVMYICRAAPKWSLREISKLLYFDGFLCRNWTQHSERGSTDGIELKDWDCVVSLE